jgi:hypothetical protein
VTVLVDGAVRYSASGEEFRAVPDVSALFFGAVQDAVRGTAGKSGEAAW